MQKFIVIFAILLLSCEEKELVPADLIEKEKFIPLLVDIQILEEHYHHLFGRASNYIEALDSASGYVFNDYHVSKNQFENSLDYYSKNADTLFSIYEAAFDTVTFRLQSK